MNSREKILKSIRQHSVNSSPRPSLEGDWIRYADPSAQFNSVLKSVGGELRQVAELTALRGELDGLPQFTEARRRCLLVEGAGEGNVELDSVGDPHELENVDFALLPAQFGVAENGALWVTPEGIRHRAIYFIVQHLALVVPAGQIVNNMHEAYDRIRIADGPFGCFISGPSKTADIEQSLVIGAHGPRSLTVFLVSR